MNRWEQFESSLWIVGDEAFLPGEHRRSYHELTDEERRTYHRDWMRRRREDPVYRAYRNARERELRRQKVMQMCPGERCLTLTPGGRVCYFCERTP